MRELPPSFEITKPKVLLHFALAGDLPTVLSHTGSSIIVPNLLDQAENGLLQGQSTTPPPGDADPNRLAYIAFTSGTTGEPKAISASQLPLAHFIEWQIDTFKLTRTDRFSMLSGLAHDPLLRDILIYITKPKSQKWITQSILSCPAFRLYVNGL